MTVARAFHPADDEAVVALYARLRGVDPTMPTMDLARWRAYRAQPIFADGADFQLVTRDDAVLALATFGKLEHPRDGVIARARVFVDPSARRAGLATSLLRSCEEIARAHRAKAIESFVEGTWTAGRAFAAARGFSVFIHDLFLTRGDAPFEAAIPEGVTLRAYRADRADDLTWATLCNATLVRDAGFFPETPERIRAHASQPGFALWIAETTEPVGFCHLELRGDVGYVQALGVVASAESRGIGAALLARAIDALASAGAKRIELCTERDNARAQRLYARAGFTLDRDAFTMRKPL